MAVRILILGGFLGSGKTTLLLQLAQHEKKRLSRSIPVAILENEIGTVGIDDRVLEHEGYAVTNMLAGCACCTLSGDLPRAVSGIQRDLDPDLLVIEATGVAVPGSMKRNVYSALGLDSRIVTLVDVSRWRRMITPLHTLLMQQLQDADSIVMNKVDLVNAEELAYVRKTVREFNKEAPLVELSAITPLPSADILNILGE